MPDGYDDEASGFDDVEAEVAADAGSAGFPSLAEAYRRAGAAERARAIAAAGLECAPQRLGGRVAHALALIDLGEFPEATRELMGILENVPEVPAVRLETLGESAEAAESIGLAELVGEVPESPSAVPAAETIAETGDEIATTDDAESTGEMGDESSSGEHPMWATPLAAPSAASGTMSPNEVRQELDNEEIDQAFEAAQPDPDGMLEAAEAVEQSWPAAAPQSAEDAFDPSAHPVFATETMAELLERQGDVARADEIRGELDGGRVGSEAAAASDDAVEWPAVPAASAAVPASAIALEVASVEEDEPAAAMDDSGDEREKIVATLETWLENIQREVA